ncbi:MAG: Methyltransferase type 11 [Deferribacteraceae bacterium]|nr:Methyltransferase type 11 [Deferribacteraceae bacterium]
MKEGFDFASLNYLNSSDHASGADLSFIKNYFKDKKFELILDIATAAGHCSKVFECNLKVGIDLSINMLNTARNEFGLIPVCASAMQIPFLDQTFDLVSCRIAMHHFENPELFFSESHRILKDKGILVLVDSIVDVEDGYLNTIEYFRDNTHIRSLTVKEVINYANNFRLLNYVQIKRKHNFYDWAKRLNVDDEKVKQIEAKFIALPEKIKQELAVCIENGRVISYTDKKGIFIFEKYDI